MVLSRERFANGLRVYGIDQGEQPEYAGRFCDYLRGSRVPISHVAHAAALSFVHVADPNVVIWDLHESREEGHAAATAAHAAR